MVFGLSSPSSQKMRHGVSERRLGRFGWRLSRAASMALGFVFATSLVVAAAPLPPDRPDVWAYAQSVGVSIAEADRRLGLQGTIGDLGARLEAREGSTFGGLYITHS